MSYINERLPSSSTTNPQRGLPGVGFKLTDDGNYDIDNKQLKNSKDGTNDTDVVSKKWIENHVSRQAADLSPYLKKDGSEPMTGNLNMNNYKIENLKDTNSSSSATEAVNKKYVDNKTADFLNKNTGGIIYGPVN